MTFREFVRYLTGLLATLKVRVKDDGCAVYS